MYRAAALAAGAAAGAGAARSRCASAADCAAGQSCAAVPTAGGQQWCVSPALTPSLEPCDGACAWCTADDNCTDGGRSGRCDAYSDGYCGGAPPPPMNRCIYPQCGGGAACPKGDGCVPRGFAGGDARYVDTCAAARCLTDADCAAGAGGACLPFDSASWCRSFQGFACAYQSSECRGDSDCTKDNPHCQPAGPYPAGDCLCGLNTTTGAPQCGLTGPPPP